MKKAMAFGAFDILHEGHEYFLKEAKKKGDFLVVTLGRDKTIEKLKKKKTINNEQKRMQNLRKLNIADKVILGSLKDPYKCLSDEKPDVICLGYDQRFFVGSLGKELRKRKIMAEIVRIPAYFPERYKSSLVSKTF